MATAVAIALGSNLGHSLEILENAVTDLRQAQGIELIAKSSWYKTTAIGPPQPDYINGCITCNVTLEAETLLDVLRTIENRYGRQRHEHWGARTLDLDLILYGQQQINLPHLQIPHPQMQNRAFVLVPLAEIAANWIDPNTQQIIATLKNKLDILAISDIQAIA